MAASSLISSLFTCSIFSCTSKTKTNHHCRSPPYKSNMITISQNNQSTWASINSEVDSHIKQALSGRQPQSVYDAMHHLIFNIPKSMAPALCIAACEAVGGHSHQALPAASALHLMHVATYTHEYLQLTGATVKPMAHHGLGTHIELLTGASMLPLGYELLAAAMEGPIDDDNSSRVLRVMVEMGHAMGAQGVVAEQYEKIIKGMDHGQVMKGGALYACGAACGAILGGGSTEDIEKIRRYGSYVGMIHGNIGIEGTEKEEGLSKLEESLAFLAMDEFDGLNKYCNVESIYGVLDE